MLVFTNIHPARCVPPSTWVSPALCYREEYELSEAKQFAQLVNGDRTGTLVRVSQSWSFLPGLTWTLPFLHAFSPGSSIPKPQPCLEL